MRLAYTHDNIFILFIACKNKKIKCLVKTLKTHFVKKAKSV